MKKNNETGTEIKQFGEISWKAEAHIEKLIDVEKKLSFFERNKESKREEFLVRGKEVLTDSGASDVDAFEKFKKEKADAFEGPVILEAAALLLGDYSEKARSKILQIWRKYELAYHDNIPEMKENVLMELDKVETIFRIATTASYASVRKHRGKALYLYREGKENGLNYFTVDGELVVLPMPGCYPWNLSRKAVRIARAHMLQNKQPITQDDVNTLTALIKAMYTDK